MKQFKLPDLGEGLQEAELIEWLVKEGDTVEVDQLIAIVETAKAIVELPSPYAGVIGKLAAAPGDTIAVGACLVEYASESGAEVHKTSTMERVEQKESASVSVVGKLESASTNVETEQFYYGAAAANKLHGETGAKKPTKEQKSGMQAPPAVTALARKLGVESLLKTKPYSEWNAAALLALVEPDTQKHDARPPDSRAHKLSGARKVMAQTMAKSHQQVPHVTLFDDALIHTWQAKQDITLRLVRALVAGCQKVPVLNAWFDEEEMTIQPFDDIHLGIAVNSAQGLFVPVIRHIQTLNEIRVRELLDRQIEQVNARTIKPQKLLGATISLSNFGTLSGRYATPIIVPPQVAILGAGKIRKEVKAIDDEIAVVPVIPLSLSFDHRAASGAEAAEFLATVIADLEKPE
ncbi:MAG: dihydrolipoamide acetyltransferase family protein [Oleiphilaceae bacterium]|nr:dihydrolipoamide acetyltransferase family protein [Oleiphilaceae bacterium]